MSEEPETECLLCGGVGTYMSCGAPSFSGVCDCPAGQAVEARRSRVALIVFSVLLILSIVIWWRS